MFKANTATKLTSANSGFNQQITAGTFSIGSATFTIDDNTTLSSLISKINENKEAQATAYWDDTTGKLSITSKKEGASFINIEAGTSNFTDVIREIVVWLSIPVRFSSFLSRFFFDRLFFSLLN